MWNIPKGILTAAALCALVTLNVGSAHADADTVFKAIGQKLDAESVEGSLDTERGKIIVDDEHRTSVDGVWAGGDCVAGGDDLTVSAVQHGKVAAIAIDRHLRA